MQKQEVGQGDLELRADTVETSSANFTPSDKIQISRTDLYLWRRQAQAINRSSNHLTAIDLLIAQEEGNFLKVSNRTYQVRCLDLEEFNNRAFELLEADMEADKYTNRVRNQLRTKKPILISKIKDLWLIVEGWLERFLRS